MTKPRPGHPAARAALAAAWGITLALLAACGSQPAATPSPPGAAPRPAPAATPSRQDGLEGFERQQRERAETAQRQGRLADAALAWEVLTALRPQHGEYRERLAATRAQIGSAVQDRIGKASAAHKRGDFDGAIQHYLAALALVPTHEAAADALRAIERDRQKRPVGRLARDPLQQRRAYDEADPRQQAPATRGLTRPAPPADRPAKPARPASAASKAR